MNHISPWYSIALIAANVIVAAAIAYFAYLTWKVTQCYARMYGLTVMLEQFKQTTSRGDSAERRAAMEAFKVVKEEFPDLFKRFEPHLPASLKNE